MSKRQQTATYFFIKAIKCVYWCPIKDSMNKNNSQGLIST